MTLRRRILLYYSGTLSLSLVIVGFWSWFEFTEQRNEALQGGAEAALKHNPLEETFEIILYGGLPAILLGIVGGGLLMRRALRPIEELTEALERTDVSNLSDPVPRSGNGDELDRMTAVFNRMKERLGLSFTQAREFTLNASHELKTPLTIMHGTLEQTILRSETTDSEREGAAALLEEVQRLSAIVGQLSFLARADAGLMPLTRESVALHDLVRDLAEEATILAAGADITVTLTECQHVSVSGDRMRLRQVLLNLADNAVKYNEHGGGIEMALQRQGDEAVFSIRNTGSALAPDLEARVFERFFRGDPAHGGAIEGSGLGLSIAKSIVEAHGGTIAYEVLPDGRTQVTVALAVVLPS
ncbi:MAG: HAMP domain-containing protein [Verrucomicrobiales bacterium]|nr:HAMP domain-containing protein [Verrucomicrobiales bacterium]